jgi:Zn-dependent protease/CBS domain-containing protein
MKWSYKVARVAGIDVKIHVTFLLLLAWFGAMYWQEGGARGAAEGVGFTLLLFLCVLLHEFGHAFAARAYGIRTPDITLLPIGGVARLERMPDKPVQELVVALAGPAVNVVIALVLLAVLAAKVRVSDFTELDRVGGSLPAKLLAVNVMLVVFNAIPAFPMDGGRVLRALLAMRLNYVLATTIAARVGQGLAVCFAVASFFGPNMLLFIAIFVFLGAQQELAYARFRSAGANRTVSEVMFSQYASIPTGTPVDHALALARSNAQPFFPVVDPRLHAVGIVSLASLENAVAQGLSGHPVDGLALAVSRIPANTPLTAAMGTLSPSVPVIIENASGQIVGILAFRG